MNKKRPLDTLLFAVLLVSVSGCCLVYNIKTAEKLRIAPTARDMIVSRSTESTLLSDVAVANLQAEPSIEVSLTPSNFADKSPLLPPIVIPPEA